jgi:2-oxoglutarate ferredoxin oxidoreductase subunit gamma
MAAVILAEAAGVYNGRHVCQTQSYGPEARGGSSKAEVVIGTREIDYPKAIRPDMLLAMNQTSCDVYFSDLKPDGLLLVDASLVEQIPTRRVIAIPFTLMARNTTGKELVANMVALGAVGQLCPHVSVKKLEAALLARIPKGTEEMNLVALRSGVKAAKKFPMDSLPPSVFSDEEEEV